MKILVLLVLLFAAVPIYGGDDDNDASHHIQVVATKTPRRISDTPANVTVITEEDLAASGAESIAEILREKGIVVTENYDSRTAGDLVYIQGLDPSKLLILIDGQRVRPGAMNSITALQRIPISAIERIEILKGPSSFLWGSDAMAGVVYIRTKRGTKGDGLSGTAGVSYKNNFYFDEDNHLVRPYVDVQHATGNFSYRLGGAFEYGYLWRPPYSVETVPGFSEEYKVKNERNEYNSYFVSGNAQYRAGEVHTFNLGATLQSEKSPLQTSIESNTMQMFMGTASYTGYLSPVFDLSIRSGISIDSSTRIAHSQHLEDVYTFHDDELLAVYYLGESLVLKGGYSFELEHFNEKHTRKIYSQQNHAIFMGGDLSIEKMLDVTAGFRYQYNVRSASGFTDSQNLHSFSPQLGAVFKPVEKFAFKANVGHSFKSPDLRTAFREYFNHSWFYAGPNPDLAPETSWGYSGQMEFMPSKQFSLHAGMYRNDLRNLIQFSDTGEYYESLPLFRPENLGKAYTWGITAGMSGGFDLTSTTAIRYDVSFESVAAYQVLEPDEQYLDEEGNRFNPRLENRPAFTLSGAISWNSTSLGTSAKISGFYFHKGYRYTNEGGGVYTEERTDSRSSLDIRVAQQISASAGRFESTIFVEVKNLLNTLYDFDGDGAPNMPERRFISGIEVKF